ncbi:TPA: hypothetical protein ACH3X2_001971 [Trebouxia sp. C0005]
MSGRNASRASLKEVDHVGGSSQGRQDSSIQASRLTLAEQALAIKPFWAKLNDDERNELLSLTLTALRQTASKSDAAVPSHQTLTGSLEELLEGLTRSDDRHLWERWQWDSQGSLFISATAFRQVSVAACQCTTLSILALLLHHWYLAPL